MIIKCVGFIQKKERKCIRENEKIRRKKENVDIGIKIIVG